MQELVRVRSLAGFEHLVQSLGGNPRSILSRLGVSVRQMDDTDAWIPFQTTLRAFQMASQQLKEPAFGYKLSKSRDLSYIGPVFLAARYSPDVAGALDCLSRYFGVQNTAVRMSSTVEVARAMRSYHMSPELRALADQWIEEAMTTFPNVLKTLAGREPEILRIRMKHQPNRKLSIYAKQYGVDVQFGQPIDAIEYSADILPCSLPDHDAQVHQFMSGYLESLVGKSGVDIEGTTRLVLETLIPLNQARIEIVAEHLGLHPRALQRRLKELGIKFSDILDDKRRAIAERLLLKRDLPLGEVAAYLGYSEQSAFNHAFLRWHGVSPTAWADAQR